MSVENIRTRVLVNGEHYAEVEISALDSHAGVDRYSWSVAAPDKGGIFDNYEGHFAVPAGTSIPQILTEAGRRFMRYLS